MRRGDGPIGLEPSAAAAMTHVLPTELLWCPRFAFLIQTELTQEQN